MRRNLKATLVSAAVTVAASVALAASGSTTVQTRKVTVNGKPETVLTTAQGMTLYYYDQDAADTSTCTGTCAKLWPAYTLKSGRPTGPDALPKGLAVFRGPNGRQVEYHGHPLYTYAKDRQPGDVNGDGVFPTWHVATPGLQAGSGSSQSGSGGSASGSSGYGSGGYGSGGSGGSGSGYGSGY